MPLHWILPPPPPPLPAAQQGLQWERLDQPVLPVKASPPSASRQPLTAEQLEQVISTIPLTSSDYQPLLNLSPAVPTASVLPPEQWRLNFTTISPFEPDTGTGNQNYAFNLDVGLSERLQVSYVATYADDPLNAPLTNFPVQPGNFWQSWAGAARWQLVHEDRWSLALNGSLEAWNVGSGGDDSFANTGDDASPNIFNDSGRRVFTRNVVGSLALPLSWQASPAWQLTFAPGISVLPSTQGAGQGGAGEFYGTNPYLGGGVLYQPFPELTLTASVAQPIGNGTNSFNADLEFSRVPILSAGLQWDLNPRIGLRGQLTNGFGATPATALLALPSDNRLGYSANFVFTADAPDTPQQPLTSRQRSLARGGLSVNTALVPPDNSSDVWITADSGNNLAGSWGYSISNVFQVQVSGDSYNKNAPQTTPQARLYAKEGAQNIRLGGKAVAFSPLRGAPFWSGGRLTLGRNNDLDNNTGQGYVFAETMATWEATPRLAFNLNPKVAWTTAGNLYGVGVSANVQIAPRWELVPEGNVVTNNIAQSNGTMGLRWSATKQFTVESYVSTAASMLDIGQLLSADELRWGGRLTYSF